MLFVPPHKWFHVTLTTYGAWLPGDPRGFRTRHHREHVEGDYQSPPKEDYRWRRRHSQALQKLPTVTFAPAHRRVVRDALLKQLHAFQLDVTIVAVAGRHAHLLCKLPDRRAAYIVGRAKSFATRSLRPHGYADRVWANGEGMKPVTDCAHWSKVVAYVKRHSDRNAAVWIWEGPTIASPGNPWRSPHHELHERPYEVVTCRETNTITVLVDGKPYKHE